MMISVALDAECHTVRQVISASGVHSDGHDVVGLQSDSIAWTALPPAHHACPVVTLEYQLTPHPMFV
jgi:hypothetical protein